MFFGAGPGSSLRHNRVASGTTIALAAALLGLACTSDARHRPHDASAVADGDVAPRESAAIDVTDDAGNPVHLPTAASRVVSLIPSATEALIAVGAATQLVGRTRYDVAPEVASLPSVGGGIDASIETIVSLHPDLVVSWESDKRQMLRGRLLALGIPVFILRTQDTSDVFGGIDRLGHLTGHDSAARAVATSVRATLDSVRRAFAGQPVPRVLYVMFNDPPMTAGRNTFIGQLISLAGGRSIFDDLDQLWPSVTMEEIVKRDPDILIVPLGEFQNTVQRFRTMQGWRTLRAVREGHIVTVPADLANRPSPNIAEAARVLGAAIHGQTVPPKK